MDPALHENYPINDDAFMFAGLHRPFGHAENASWNRRCIQAGPTIAIHEA